MALDLTPRFRRLNSQTRSFRENIQNGFSGPFGATQLWHNIIHALHSQIQVRRCRRHLRLHSDCFTGSDAVDTVLSYLMQNVAFCTSEVSRLKAARLCQALMEANVFEPIGSNLFHRDKEASFEDSSCSLYRFLEHGASSVTVLQDENELGEEEIGKKKKKKSSRLRELRTISNPLAVGPSDRRVERLLRNIALQPSCTVALKTSPTAHSFLSKAVVDDVWKQHTLSQLLQIVDVPMLDSILTSPGRVPFQTHRPPLTNQDLIISNTCLGRELPEALTLTQSDGWLSAAARCLELLPDELIVVAEEQLSQTSVCSSEKENAEQKRLLFDTIAKFYSNQERAPLLSGRHLDIHAAILNLLDEGKMPEAIKASQLCLRLLETSVRDELQRLLTFMATAAKTDACRLQKQTDNRTLVCRTFQKALVQNQELSRSQSETLVLFLTDNHTELFKTPSALIEAVRRTLRTLQQGKDLDSIASFTFCQQATPQEYEDQRESSTFENLKLLLSSISSNQSLPAKEKKRLLREFEKHHPVVFLQHFSSTSPAVEPRVL